MEDKPKKETEIGLIELTVVAFKRLLLLFIIIFSLLQLSWYYEVINYGQGSLYFELAYYLPCFGTFLGLPILVLLTFVFSLLTWRRALATIWSLYGALVIMSILLTLLHPFVDKLAMNTLVGRLEPIVKQVENNAKTTVDAKEMERLLKTLPQKAELHKSVVTNLLPKMRVIRISIDKKERCSLKLPLQMWTPDGEENALILKVAKEHTGMDPSYQLNFDKEQHVTPVGKWLRHRVVFRDTGFVQ